MCSKLIFLYAVLFVSLQINAQADDCVEKLSIFAELAKTKNYEDAYPHLQYLRKECATLHKGVYLYGEYTLNYKIDNAANNDEKEKYVRDLLLMYDQFDTHFPNNGRGNNIRKAMALFENNVGSKEEVYKILDNAFKSNEVNFSNPKAPYVYFEIYVDNFEKGNQGIELQDVFNKYDFIIEKLGEESKELSNELDALISKEESEALTDREEADKNRYQVNLEAFNTVISSMDAKISAMSNCDRLIPFFSESFEAKKGDEEWLRRTADRLDSKGCSTDPLFSKISEALHQLNPSARSAYNLGVAAYNAKNTSKALEYFNQSAALHTDNNEKAKVYYTIATSIYGNSNKAQAVNYAQKALTARPSFGKAYLYIAQLYAASTNECGATPFEKRAINWLAAETARKAGQVDSALKGTADQQASGYEQRAPSRQDIFSADMAGKTVSFGCWVGKTIKVPNL
jgi:tetratricopeptide (TPR) repeat protein